MGSDAPLVDIAEESVVDFETAVMPIPQYDPAHPQMISQGPSLCIFNKEDPQEVLASWLFAQYMLSNPVQTAYSETEGYVPVTTAAQNSPQYQDYLSQAGEDDSTYYDVKIKAAKLLLEHEADTFVTPVFNGSASLRNAAGQLIEEVTKSVRRKQTVDDAYLEELRSKITSLYHLDEFSGMSGEQTDLGPLPLASKILLGTLAGIWILLILYGAGSKIKKRN